MNIWKLLFSRFLIVQRNLHFSYEVHKNDACYFQNSAPFFTQVTPSSIQAYPCNGNNNYLLHQQFYRRYSLASYQPLCIPGISVVASQLHYCYAQPPVQPTIVRGRIQSETVYPHKEIRSKVAEDEDDDDVFASAPMHQPAQHLNPMSLQECRKRARSVGELASQPQIFLSNNFKETNNSLTMPGSTSSLPSSKTLMPEIFDSTSKSGSFQPPHKKRKVPTNGSLARNDFQDSG